MKVIFLIVGESDAIWTLAQQYGPGALAFLILLIAIIRQGHKMDVGFERADRKMEGLTNDLRNEMSAKFHEVRHEMHMGFQSIRNEMALGFEKADRKLENEIKDIRNEMHHGFKDIRAEIKDLRTEMKEGFAKRDHEIEKIDSILKVNKDLIDDSKVKSQGQSK